MSIISNFDELLFTPKLRIGVFLQRGKSHALNGRSDSTSRMLTLFLGHKIRFQVRFCEQEIRKNVKIPQDYYP